MNHISIWPTLNYLRSCPNTSNTSRYPTGILSSGDTWDIPSCYTQREPTNPGIPSVQIGTSQDIPDEGEAHVSCRYSQILSKFCAPLFYINMFLQNTAYPHLLFMTRSVIADQLVIHRADICDQPCRAASHRSQETRRSR